MTQQANQAAEEIYKKIKDEIFDFQLLPGDRFTETELAERYGTSRTPVRGALYRLKHEGYFEVQFRSGWRVRPFDFVHFDELYDLRTVLETAAVERLCRLENPPLGDLKATWLVPASRREHDARIVAALDEAFHCRLLEAAGNREMSRVHSEVTEKIRIVRRLGFLEQKRIDATYEDHAKLLKLINNHRAADACTLLRGHVTQNGTEARKITIHMLHEARERARLLRNPGKDAAPSRRSGKSAPITLS
ncbi:MAG TPA: GntR family transcriptional regulator [Micropepsaceae bacterium]|nr:GntR family transcriptional regulator [Micropepsaceae bacterium]